jgi:hypothetical protein
MREKRSQNIEQNRRKNIFRPNISFVRFHMSAKFVINSQSKDNTERLMALYRKREKKLKIKTNGS